MKSYFPGLWAITLNTFRETVRDRILYAFVLFAFLFTLFGIVLGSLSVGQDVRVLEDLGLSVMSLIGGIIAIFVGTTLVYKEIDRRTVYLIFTKPISRWQFVTGKFLGLALCLLVVTLAMGAFLVGLVSFFAGAGACSFQLLSAIALTYLELMFVIALALFFSTFATPLMSVLFTLAIWLIGHMGQSLLQFGKMSKSVLSSQICNVLYGLMPDFAKLTQVRFALVAQRPVDIEVVFYLLAYILLYIVLLLLLSTVVTERREFS